MYFGVDRDVIYFLRSLLAYMCGTKPFQVFIVLIAVTPVQSWSKAKAVCNSCEGIDGEFER
jgi:phage shock protein PspC (stress-responsive transcriptional regulator)